MSRGLNIGILLVVLGVSSSLWAGQYVDPGLTLGFGGGMILDNFDYDEISFESNWDADPSMTGTVKLGYRFGDHFEIEAEYLHVDGFDMTYKGVQAAVMDGYALTACGKIYPSARYNVEPYILLGMGIADFEISDTLGLNLSASESDQVLRWGAGIHYVTEDNITLFLEASYYRTLGDLDDTDFIPIIAGVKLNF